MSIVAALKDDADISALIGGRIYRIIAPARAQYPFILIHDVAETRGAHLDGSDKIRRAIVQVDVVGHNGKDVVDISTKVADKLHAKAISGSGYYELRNIRSDANRQESGRAIFRKSLDFNIIEARDD